MHMHMQQSDPDWHIIFIGNSMTGGRSQRQSGGGAGGAGDRDRTGDIQLGKLTFCH